MQHQERIVQNQVEMIVEVPKPQVVEKTIQVPKIHIEEKTIKIPKVHNTIVHTHTQHQMQPIEVEKPKIIHKIVKRKQQVSVPKVVHRPQEVNQIQYVDE